MQEQPNQPDNDEAARIRREVERFVHDQLEREVIAGRLERCGVNPDTGYFIYRRPEAKP